MAGDVPVMPRARRTSRHGRRSALKALVLLVAAAVLAAVVLGARGLGGGARASGSDGRPAAAAATRPLAQGRMVDFSLVLRLPAQARLDRFLAGLEQPGSRDYHHFLDARQFGRRFGLSAAVLRRLGRQLGRQGVDVVREYPQRTSVDVRAPAGTVERLFAVRLSRTRAGLQMSGRPRIPESMRRAVRSIAGLSSQRELADDVPAGGLTPTDARTAYDINPLYSQGITGQGEAVAVISFAGYSAHDLAQFDQHFGLPVLAPVSVSVDGGSNDNNPGDESEVELDMEIVHEIAPQATVLDYNAPQVDASGGDTLGAMIDRVVADGRARIVTDSWGACELTTQPGDIQRDEQAIEAAVAHGVSIFKAAGDAGAYQCQRSNPSDHRLSIEWPTASPGVIAVGGTALSVGAGGAYAGETAWEDPLEQSGGGGGLSANFARPSWQRAPGVQNSYSNGHRQIPDVAADADVATGWSTYTGGSSGEVGGTSAASPFWAAAMALIDEYARRHGVARLGFVDPALYAIASSSQPAPPFHDVTVGTNRYYPATPGWDFATGLGSPDVANLARDMVAYLRR